MINEERIKEMISDFAKIYNSKLENLPSLNDHYSQWPNSFKGEESEIARKIYGYIARKNSKTSTSVWRITSFFEKEILENILLSNPLHKS